MIVQLRVVSIFTALLYIAIKHVNDNNKIPSYVTQTLEHVANTSATSHTYLDHV